MAVRRVLIVDDAPGVRQDLRMLLTLAGNMDAGHPIEIVGEAANGLEAVELVQVLKPEAVLLDLDMPIMDGYEAARQIKALAPSCRVVALTVHGYPEARQKASQAGVDGFIVKGSPVEIILQSILINN